MKKQKVVAIFGYNNTRIYDVKKIKDLIQKRCDAEVLLIKESVEAQDLEVTHFCFDHRPDDPNITDELKVYLDNNLLELIGCLPFSDKGVVGAAHVAKQFNLFGDDPNSSFAMLDKNLFRELELQIPINETVYKKPFFHVVHFADEIFNLFALKGAFFIKPRAEGNSRGCMKIESLADIIQWLDDNSQCLKSGVICEEILSNNNEFSFDGIDNNYWITQKFTTSGAYRAEYQQIVPAPFNEIETKRIHGILKPLLGHLGSNGGAFHHEFFLLEDQRVASVEPNRRPAGMWIWDLASWAFEGFNPWIRWVDRCTQTETEKIELTPKYFAGVRGVISAENGCLSEIKRENIEKELCTLFGPDNYRLSFLKSENSLVRSIPRDNSDFLAMIAIRNQNYEKLLENCFGPRFTRHLV
jgi:hypothetical protein